MLKQFVGLISPKMKSLKRIYGLIRKNGAVSTNTLIELTGYKPATCARLIEELVQSGVIYNCGLGESSGGRKPLMYAIEPNANYLIGIDISRSFTTVVLLDLKLNILSVNKLEMQSFCTADYTLEYICNRIHEMLHKHNLPLQKVLGIGVGVFGPLDRESGMILEMENGWGNINIVEYLKKHFDTLILLDNGANLAALGEYRRRYWKDIDNLAYTLCGTGIRSGFVLKGEVVDSKMNMDSSLGHIIVDIHGPKCSCGSYGCLETFSSVSAIRKEIIRQMKRGKTSVIQDIVNDPEEIRFDHILKALDDRDSLCSSVVQEAAFYYGIGLSNLVYLMRPDVVVVGGALGPKPIFFETAMETAKQRIQYYPNYQVEFKAASDYNAVAVGAGSLIFDYFIETA
ncbi:ROK family transcriptional regulator [Pseudalkalibacillus decolorationis]|uniref:ROK family transcriptional regulator n=1 Tax=Pseudalkalibacillus decolorationis TaxID=163879 RepID=UPI00214760A7|nr:ROK family transcriptional regulator [Pseudalkalibacillus decolorationis]